MFYETGSNDHSLPFNPFKSRVIPRPIGWITSLDKAGVVNLAPYSYFNAVTDRLWLFFLRPAGIMMAS